MIVSNNTMQEEGVGDLFKNLGKKMTKCVKTKRQKTY